MSALQTWGAAAAEVWGLILLVVVILTFPAAIFYWIREGIRTARVRLARGRYSAEAIREAEAELRRAARTQS